VSMAAPTICHSEPKARNLGAAIEGDPSSQALFETTKGLVTFGGLSP
jgi:hypothetical protein